MPSFRVNPGPSLTVMAACLGERPERGWLTHLEAHGAELSLTFVETRVALVRRARTLRPRVILLPLSDANGVPSAPLIARLREWTPSVRVLVLISPETTRAGLADAIRAGGEVVVLSGEDELRSALFRMADLGPLSVPELDAASALLSRLRPSELRETLLYCVVHAHRRLTVHDVATSRGMSSRALGRQSRVGRWPPPSELIAWGRLLRASILQWSESTPPLSALVYASGFASARTMERTSLRLLQRSIEHASDLVPLLVGSRLHRRLHALTLV
ncbi:MAG: hypothetical protein ABI664_15350 [bacterium]